MSRFCLLLLAIHCVCHYALASSHNTSNRDAFIESLVFEMTVPEIVLQLYLLFADNIIGPRSDNGLYDSTLGLAPAAGIGVIHDWYPMNKTYYNDLQRLNSQRSRLSIPFMQTGECLHGVGSFKQSMFPAPIGMSATFDMLAIQHVGKAIGTEARAIGIHACLAPVLDLCQDSRWGRCQEDWGEDQILTSHMGVAFASGLSNNGNWSSPNAVVPVMKHFAAHGSAQSGINTAPFMGHGRRQVLEQLLIPFKAAVELGGVGGVLMAYNEIDGIPAPVDPMLYDQLESWGFDGFVISDDLGIAQLETVHLVADSPADAISQWLNAGGMISYYDYPLETYLNAIVELVANNTIAIDGLRTKMRRILGVKYDLGLFEDPYIPDEIDVNQLTVQHFPLSLEVAQKSIVLLENHNSTLPLPANSPISIALIGPFADSQNFGDYSGQFGEYPAAHAATIQQGILKYCQGNGSTGCNLSSSWGANTWLYNAQYAIPGYHLSANGTLGGLLATYYVDTNFSQPLVQKIEVPARDWGLYPPPGLPSNNFSATWTGTLNVPVSIATDGWLGVAISYNATANLYIDDELLVSIPSTTTGNILSNIPSRQYSAVNSTAPPPGSAPFTFLPNATHRIRLEFTSLNLYQKIQNTNSLNAEVLLFWNLVDRNKPIEKAVSVASAADIVVLAVGANWNSDGENGDRGTMGLSANQTALSNAIFNTGRPVVMVLEGGRPFAIPEMYNRSAAVLNTFFGGQAGGQAIADVLFGTFNPGGRLPLTVPAHVGQMPVYYNYKPSAHLATYVDIDAAPAYPFGYGLSYTNFSVSAFKAVGRSELTNATTNFGTSDTLHFEVTLKNTGSLAGSFVPQVYLLGRISQVTRPVKQLVAFTRVYLEPGEQKLVDLEVDVDRYLKILNRRWEWELEKGPYTFALLENGGMFADTSMNVTLACTG